MEIERMFLLLHVLCLVGAAIGIVFADLSGLLRTGSRLVAGMLIIWIDTGFDLVLIASRPKVMLNGHLLHRYFFKAVNSRPTNVRQAPTGLRSWRLSAEPLG